MGSSVSCKKEHVSTKLEKPEDCSNEIWKKILRLFDILDTDGTHSIEENEIMGHIADLHVKNNINKLVENKKRLHQKMKMKKEKINKEKEFKINEINELAQQNIQNIDSYLDTYDKSIERDKEKLEKMTPEEKANKIKNAICGSKESIEFWDFYKYMKNRTEDIPNIVW